MPDGESLLWFGAWSVWTPWQPPSEEGDLGRLQRLRLTRRLFHTQSRLVGFSHAAMVGATAGEVCLWLGQRQHQPKRTPNRKVVAQKQKSTRKRPVSQSPVGSPVQTTTPSDMPPLWCELMSGPLSQNGTRPESSTKSGPHVSCDIHVFTPQRRLHTDAFYTQKLLHTDAFTHRGLAFTHRSFYTQKLLHTEAFTYRRSFYSQKLLRTEI